MAGALNEWKRKAGSNIGWEWALYNRARILELMVRPRERMSGEEIFLMDEEIEVKPILKWGDVLVKLCSIQSKGI